jgi:hypothetical protein
LAAEKGLAELGKKGFSGRKRAGRARKKGLFASVVCVHVGE